jgi:hypothetical protein
MVEDVGWMKFAADSAPWNLLTYFMVQDII